MGKRFNPNLAKIHRNYTVEEVAELYAVHKNTVRQWIKSGLATCDNKRPMLILGCDLRKYLQAKRAKNKQKCKPDELYCMRCKMPRKPAGKMVDYEPINSTTGRLIGICPACSSIINKYIGLTKLKEIQDQLDIRIPKTLEHINESVQPPLNSDFKQ